MFEAIPMCVMCGDLEVQIVVNSTGFGTDEDYGYYGGE